MLVVLFWLNIICIQPETKGFVQIHHTERTIFSTFRSVRIETKTYIVCVCNNIHFRPIWYYVCIYKWVQLLCNGHVRPFKISYPDSKVHGANKRPSWVLSAPVGSHVGPMNLAIRVFIIYSHAILWELQATHQHMTPATLQVFLKYPPRTKIDIHLNSDHKCRFLWKTLLSCSIFTAHRGFVDSPYYLKTHGQHVFHVTFITTNDVGIIKM